MHALAVSCRVSHREIRSDWCSSWHEIEAGLSIMAMRFDDRTGQSGRIANFVHSARGFIACPGCGPACEWDAAQEARRVATPMRVQLPRNGIMRALYGAESVQQPLKTIAPTVVHRRSSWKRWNFNEMRNGVRGLSGRCMYNCCVCLQCARCTGGYAPPAVTGRIGDVGMRLVAITVREKRLCEKWEPHDMNGVPMKHDGADAPRGACAIIRMVRVRSASGREGLVVRLGV